ncbi:MAG: hypothetical protein IJ190_01630 [Prevotella sp.]|nr:hypothetical protein [Prevotella sp.]
MKKKLLFMLTLLAGFATANAQSDHSRTKVEVSATVMKGGEGTITVNLTNPDVTYCGYQFEFELPDGVSFVETAVGSGLVKQTKGARLDDTHLLSSSVATSRFTDLSSANIPYAGTEGTLVTIAIKGDESLNIGDKLTATIRNMVFTHSSTDDVKPADFDFDIEVVENRLILDENSTTVPEAATGVNVKVKRTIKANEWSTICLPFALSEAQVKAAFGSDVEVKDFTSWSSEMDDVSEKIISITLGFTSVSAIEANHPYVIKVSSNISEFNADGVNIAPEDEPTKQVGTRKGYRGYFIGTYTADTEVPEENLFISGNKFWYSNGTTKTKGFRGFFQLDDVLADMTASARAITIVDGTTGIKVVNAERLSDGLYYDLSGRRVENPAKGVYIVNGKKVVVK